MTGGRKRGKLSNPRFEVGEQNRLTGWLAGMLAVLQTRFDLFEQLRQLDGLSVVVEAACRDCPFTIAC
jgi:hypothetical protein